MRILFRLLEEKKYKEIVHPLLFLKVKYGIFRVLKNLSYFLCISCSNRGRAAKKIKRLLSPAENIAIVFREGNREFQFQKQLIFSIFKDHQLIVGIVVIADPGTVPINSR